LLPTTFRPPSLSLSLLPSPLLPFGEFPDQADAEWIVIRGSLVGHKDTPCGRLTPASLSAAWGLATLRAYFFFFNLLLLVLISNIIFKHCPPDRGIDLFCLQIVVLQCESPRSIEKHVPSGEFRGQYGRMARGGHRLP
jgi:hypothetical protein